MPYYEIKLQFYSKEDAELAKEIIKRYFHDDELMGWSKVYEKE